MPKPLPLLLLSIATLLGRFESHAQYFDLHNHLNLYHYLTDTRFVDPRTERTANGKDRSHAHADGGSWHIQNQYIDCKGHKAWQAGKQANFATYTQTSLSMLKYSKLRMVVNSLYSLEKDLYDQWIIRNLVGKVISGIRQEKADFLGLFVQNGLQNHPSIYHDLMGIYNSMLNHRRHHGVQTVSTSFFDPNTVRWNRTYTSDSHQVYLKFPVVAKDLTEDTNDIQVLFSIEGVHNLMDHTPLEYLRSLRKQRLIDQFGQDALDMGKMLDKAFNLQYANWEVIENFQKNYHNKKCSKDRKGKPDTLANPFDTMQANGHYLIDSLLERDKVLLRLLDFKTHANFHQTTIDQYNLPNAFSEGRLLYLTFSHFLNNRIVRQADVLDHKNPFNQYIINKAIKRGTLPGFNGFHYLRKQDMTPPFTPLGLDVLHLCMDTKYGFPVAVDVKHMDASTRQWLYRYCAKELASYEKGGSDAKFHTINFHYYDTTHQRQEANLKTEINGRVPFICSHAGVSMLSGLDEAASLEKLLDTGWINNRRAVKEAGRSGKAMDRSGLLYPLPINLTDEDILAIHRSGGIVGFNLDERILGTSMERYKGRKLDKETMGYDYMMAQPLAFKIPTLLNVDSPHRKAEKKKRKATMLRYRGIEPLLRNVMHTVWVVQNMDGVNGRNERLKKKAPLYIQDAMLSVCLGTDFDGIIDPLDNYKTVEDLDQLKSDFEKFLPYYLTLDPDRHAAELLWNTSKNLEGITQFSKAITDHFFEKNGRAFVTRFMSVGK